MPSLADDVAPRPAEDDHVAVLRARVDAVDVWWHSIDLGHGVVTPGHKSPARHRAEEDALEIPDLAGKTVLDIGAWDGYYSFYAERAGASQVVALDHYVWSIDLGPMFEQPRNPRRPPIEEDPVLWDPVGLPGKAGFDLAHEVLGSRVEPVVLDFANDDLDAIGTFDVVFFLGVLYHLANPLGGLRKLRELTDGLAIIETEAIALGGRPDACAAEFMGTRKHLDDPSNFWAPTRKGIEALCGAARFSRVEHVGPAPPEPAAGEWAPYRAMVHACR